MPYIRFSRSRRQPKWITKQILEDFPTKRPAHPAKIVKHISGPLADGSVVKEISDFEVYIKAVFSSESLEEVTREDDSELDWNKALIIVNRYTVEFKFHEELKFCEFYIKIEKFQIWDVQEGFDLKEDVKFCMDNSAVLEKATLKWEEMRTSHSESFSLTQFLEAMMQKDSDLSLSQMDGGDDTQNTTPEESQSFPVTHSATTENPLDVLRADFSMDEFRISDTQQRELEEIREWDEDYLPTQSDIESPPVDSGQPSHCMDSPDDIQPGQPNQDRVQIIRWSGRKKSKENRASDKRDVRVTEADQPNPESVTSSVGAKNTKKPQQSENTDHQSDRVNQSNNRVNQSNDRVNQSNDSVNQSNGSVNPSNASFGGTQEFVPHLMGDDMLCTAPFTPQLSTNISPGQISLANNSSDNLLIQDTSPILISSSGEANNSTGETPKNSANESGKSSSDEPQFHLSRPNISVSPDNSTETSQESPRLKRLTRSSKKTFQECFESMIESERLTQLASSSKQQQSRSRKRLLEESNEEEASDKKQRTENSRNSTTEKNSSEKSSSASRGGLISNVMNKLRSFMGESSEIRTSLEQEHFADSEENNENLLSSSTDEPDEESQSIIQSCRGLSKGNHDNRRRDDTLEKSTASSGVMGRNDFTSDETKQDRNPSGQEDVPIVIDTSSVEEANSQEVCIMASHGNSENQAKTHTALMEQDQEISSSIGSQTPSQIILPKQSEPDDEIGQKLFNLKLPPNLKTKLMNYWKT